MRVKTVLRRTIQIAEPALGREELEAVREVFECMHACTNCLEEYLRHFLRVALFLSVSPFPVFSVYNVYLEAYSMAA